jgi:hypothetical protein
MQIASCACLNAKNECLEGHAGRSKGHAGRSKGHVPTTLLFNVFWTLIKRCRNVEPTSCSNVNPHVVTPFLRVHKITVSTLPRRSGNVRTTLD